ncbi:hypothetical protein FA15DRAFT_663630 [Coprinopsis marcescibilis]|uniref:Nucleoside diphosphatase n=1 Tax=Coprinopsis marcescibilis TaxID=230819 RepID=A0A5C3LBM8_COPMA|nr:hypothetical protein FA15DRAFT_663630 [Coprinopsis marcescibilis]
MAPPIANDPWLRGRHFGIVIDAGSSGSRLQIYSWQDPRTIKVEKDSVLSTSLPKVVKGTKQEADWVKKVEPGISTLGDNPEDVGSYLRPLLNHALEHIPPSLHRETPIFLLATAGMRLLPPNKQAHILHETCIFLRTQSNFKLDRKSPAGPCGSSVRIITGEEEGLFGWIAVNYLMDGFTGSNDQRTTYGFLDMGGASTQIAFEPSKEHRRSAKNLIDVRLRLMGGQEIRHKVFVTTWLGYGTNQARERYVGKAISQFEAHRDDDDEEDVVEDPCLPKHLELTESPVHTSPASSHSSTSHTLIGTGSFEQCLRATAPLLNKSKPCPDTHCLMNGVYVPPIDFSSSHFIGISEYWYSSDHIFGLGGAYDFVQYERAASEFCSRDWSDLVKTHEEESRKHHLGGDGEIESGGKVVGVGQWGPTVETARLQMQCFKAAWITNVLHEGIGLPRIVDPGGNGTTKGDKVVAQAEKKGLGRPAFQSMDTVGDLAITWTLGKMVVEASKEIPAISKFAKPIVDPIDDVEDLEDAPFQPIRPPLLSLAGLEDRLTPHLPTSLSRENLGFSPVLFVLYVITILLLVFVCYPFRKRIRSFCLRAMRGAAKRDPYGDLLEEGRLGGGSRPASPTMFGTKVPSPFRRFFPSNRPINRTLTLMTPSKSYRNGNSSQRPSPTRLYSHPQNGLPQLATASAMQYAHVSGVSSRSPSPAPQSFMDDTQSIISPRSRNASQMNLAASLTPRPMTMSRVNSSARIV